MEMLIAVAAALLYFAALAQIVPGLSGSNQIKAKPVFFSALGALALHALLLKDLIFIGLGKT